MKGIAILEVQIHPRWRKPGLERGHAKGTVLVAEEPVVLRHVLCSPGQVRLELRNPTHGPSSRLFQPGTSFEFPLDNPVYLEYARY